MSNKLYINRTIELTKGNDGFYRDYFGVIYALPDKHSSVDSANRCGIGVFSLPHEMNLNEACRLHDYAYSSPVYQYYKTRAEADNALEAHARLLGRPIIGKFFKLISRIFGGRYWENDETR